MKNLILIACSLLIVSVVSGQTLAKKPHYKNENTTVDQMSVPAFQSYVAEVEKRMSYNNQQLSDLRFFVINLQTVINKHVVSKVNDLQKELAELKTDLNNFKLYGLGDWKLFQAEFNQDLKSVSTDLDYMHTALVKDYLLANN
jgi:hypothetical protein